MKTIGAWILLGMLMLVFGLQFGLPSDAISCGVQPIARTYGRNIADEDYQYQYRAVSLTNKPPDDPRVQEMMGLREEILDAILERRVAGEVARQIGLANETSDSEDLTGDGHFIVLGKTWDFLGGQPFNYSWFERGWLGRFGVSEQRYLEYQREELLARAVRDVVAAATVVSEVELRAVYDERQNQLSLRYGRFETGRFADLVDPARADIEKYAAEHKDELVKQFSAQGSRFLKLPRQVRLRLISVKKPSAPAADADKATKAAYDEALAAARGKVDGALGRVKAGEDFRAVARAVSDDEVTARRGGLYDWVSLEGTGSGLDPAVDDAAKGLAAGAHSERVEGEDAFYVVKVDGVREGDVPQDDAVFELAEEALARERGKALAKQAAAEALQALKDGAAMAKLFRAPEGLGGPGVDEVGLPSETGTPGAPAKDERPELRVTGLFSKGKPIPGLGLNPDLAKAAWAADPKAEFIDGVYETEGGFVVAALERKETATDDGFAAARAALYRELVTSKAAKVTSYLLLHTCLTDKARGDIVAYDERVKRLMTYDTKEAVDEEGNRRLKPYVMCDRVGARGGMLKLGALTRGGR